MPAALLSTVEGFRVACASAQTWTAYFELFKVVNEWSTESQWNVLWSILTSFTDEHSDRIAGFVLLNVDPPPQQSLASLLSVIAESRWYLSNRSVPLYLTSWFGKNQLLEAIDSVLREGGLSQDGRTRMEGVMYWANRPATVLAEEYCYFEWQEAIERGNG